MDSLISPARLAELLQDDKAVVVDASAHLPDTERDARKEYDESHIPGARFLDLGNFSDPQSPVPKAVPSAEQFAQKMRELGIAEDSAVVLYDDSALKTSCRAWFIFRLYGKKDVATLDGGLAAWREADHSLENGEPDFAKSSYSVPEQGDALRSKAQMYANTQSAEEQIVDARDAGRFSGKTDDGVHGLPGGHIPGACNVPFPQLFDRQGKFLPVDEMREKFRDAGIDPEKPVVATCGSGVTACVLLFALHLVGAKDSALYDGSWLEWGSDPQMPKASTGGS